MYKKFIKSLKINSVATFLFQISLLLHQIMLYSVISKTLYGVQSTIFAIIYITIAFTDFGFQETLLPFFSTYIKNKHQFLQAWHHFITQIISMFIVSCMFYYTMLNTSGEFWQNIRINCNNNLLFIISCIFFIENFKKSLKAMMQLAFLSKEIAFAEIGMLFFYISTVWYNYYHYMSISLNTIFIPMLTTSTLELCYLFYVFFNFYNALPSTTKSIKIPIKKIISQRILNYINQLSKTIYSSNGMTIFFAYILGFQQAATVKFYTTIITLCYTCISKSIGVSSGAALSAINQTSSVEVKSLFKDINKHYIRFLYTLSIVLIIVIGNSWYFSKVTKIMAWHIVLFFIISFFNNLSLTYEQFFISQHASKKLVIINIIGLVVIGSSIIFLHLHGFTNQFTFIFIFITTKLALLLTMKQLT